MKSFNRAIEKAFAHSGEDDNIDELLACLGEELGCMRISIFEENEEGTCDNTYEWCAQGVIRERILLQHMEIARFDTWHDRLISRENIIVRRQEDLTASDPDVYRLFVDQGIHRALVTLLAFHGRNFGFCILEDPAEEVMDDHELIMPGIRYILSSMIYSRNLVSKLKRLGYIDTLTGVGNRVSLHEYLNQLDHRRSVSVICVDVIGWDNSKGKIPHLEKEQTLLRSGEVLTNIFDAEHVFRVDTGEFIIVRNGTGEAEFETDLRTIRGLFQEHNLLASLAGEIRMLGKGSVDDLIHEVHTKNEEEKNLLIRHRSKKPHRSNTKLKESGKAVIDLPRSEAFFRIADRFLSELFEESVVAVVADINYFKLYNDIFGRKAGDAFLETIARTIGAIARQFGGIAGYMGGDGFFVLAPTSREQREILPIIEEAYKTLEFPDGFAPALGVYYSDDRRESTVTLYDRALSAVSEIKGDYIRHIHFYSAERQRHQKEDKLLLMDVKTGLETGDFMFYIQPQVNERTGKIIGGEALVRWQHDGNLISPAQFIPILEKTGHIFAVDCYVWESVAKWQRSLIDRGIEPVSISVNVSRVDFYFDDIAQRFIGLIEKYALDPGLIGVEITESAFTNNTDLIIDAVRRLHDAGFHILMDDFGSGSSSLSMLHSMNLDVLKTDVKFMSRDEQDNKAISIVEAVISMAHMIGMHVVTEGVETEKQKNNLIAIGDNFAQGFFFYRPMPAEQFEELIRDPANVSTGYGRKEDQSAGHLRFRDMIREGLVSETLLDNILRAAAVLREEDGEISFVQVNDLYTSITGITPAEDGRTGQSANLDPEEAARLARLLSAALTHPLRGSEGPVRFRKPDGEEAEVQMRIFLLYALDQHRMFLSMIG